MFGPTFFFPTFPPILCAQLAVHANRFNQNTIMIHSINTLSAFKVYMVSREGIDRKYYNRMLTMYTLNTRRLLTQERY